MHSLYPGFSCQSSQPHDSQALPLRVNILLSEGLQILQRRIPELVGPVVGWGGVSEWVKGD